MSESAWVTLATNDTYSLGALVLAHSLRAVGTKHQLAVLVTPGVTNPMRENLATVFNLVFEVNILDSKDESNLRLLKRPELGITFTKLHCWRLTQFKKCVFLDADTMVLQNSDELFERDEFSAAPDVGWPDCFNSGVFVYCPSNDTYDKLIKFALEKGSFDGGDQGLLNMYFSDWAHKDISKHLPFIYNMCSTACYSYLPAYKQFGMNAKIVHFIGNTKPWMQHFDLKNKRVQPAPELQHLYSILQKWWDFFCSYIHPQLNREMAENVQVQHIARQSTSDCDTLDLQVNNEVECLDSTNIGVDLHFREIVDPWEEYDERCNKAVDNSHVVELFEPPITEDIFSVQSLVHKNITVDESNNRVAQNFSNSFSAPFSSAPPVCIENSVHTKAFSDPIAPTTPINFQPDSTHCTDLSDINNSNKQTLNFSHTSNISTLTNWETKPNEISLPKDPETALISKDVEAKPTIDAGLAGLFAQCTLGADGQNALEDHIHRQSWEVGNIDYLGRDSFDNIWNKICQTLGQAPEKKETSPVSTPAAQETEVSGELSAAKPEIEKVPEKVISGQPEKLVSDLEKTPISDSSVPPVEATTPEPVIIQKPTAAAEIKPQIPEISDSGSSVEITKVSEPVSPAPIPSEPPVTESKVTEAVVASAPSSAPITKLASEISPPTTESPVESAAPVCQKESSKVPEEKVALPVVEDKKVVATPPSESVSDTQTKAKPELASPIPVTQLETKPEPITQTKTPPTTPPVKSEQSISAPHKPEQEKAPETETKATTQPEPPKTKAAEKPKSTETKSPEAKKPEPPKSETKATASAVEKPKGSELKKSESTSGQSEAKKEAKEADPKKSEGQAPTPPPRKAGEGKKKGKK